MSDLTKDEAIAVLRNLQDWLYFSAMNGGTKLQREAIDVAIEAIRSEPKRGEWTADNACSECGCQPWYSRDIHIYKFCPNCGAKMEVTE